MYVAGTKNPELRHINQQLLIFYIVDVFRHDRGDIDISKIEIKLTVLI